jgi:hypothetical protein
MEAGHKRPESGALDLDPMNIATSREPSAAPNAKSANPSKTGDPATASNGKRTTRPNPPARMMGRLPYLALRTPVKSIAAIDPTPRQSSSSPNMPSST